MSPPRRRSLMVPLRVTQRGYASQRGYANADDRTDGQGAAQELEEASGTSSTSSSSSCLDSKNPAARTLLPDRISPLLEEASRFHGSTVQDTCTSAPSENPVGEFTFRTSSTLKARASQESAGFDLVGAVVCGPPESPISSISSQRFSGKRCAYS